MVHRKRVLQAVSRHVPSRPEATDIVDQDIEARIPIEYRSGEPADLSLGRQVCAERVHTRAPARTPDVDGSLLDTRQIPAGDRHAGAESAVRSPSPSRCRRYRR